MTLRFCFSLPFFQLVEVRSQSSLRSLIYAMAGAGENFSTISGSSDALPIDSSNSQINGGVADLSNSDDLTHGFQRPEMYTSNLAGTIGSYDRHVFLCYKNAESWPPSVESSEFDRLPRLLAAALKSRKDDIQGKIRLTICEGRDGSESPNGDILIFPEMIRYRGLTHFDVDNFVEDVLVKGVAWVSGVPETLTGSHVFVCAHGSRDKRCGVCGPILVDKLKEEIELRGLKDQVFVSPCSHIGGHKYAGNLIIFSPNSEGKVTGHWYGYVTPNDVPILIDQHIGKGEIIEKLWRGQMGPSNEEEKKIDEQKHKENGGMTYLNGTNSEKVEKEPQESGNLTNGGGCCQGANGFSCCMDGRVEKDSVIAEKKPKEGTDLGTKKGLGRLSAWMETWEQGDVLAVGAVIGAVASVAVAYSFYRRSG